MFLTRRRHPFGKSPRASREAYLQLWEEGSNRRSHAIDSIESAYGQQIDREWLDHLALRTQVVVKTSPLDWNHGRLIYSVLAHQLGRVRRSTEVGPFVCFETGTARGFSAVVMARALLDAGVPGTVHTVDRLPHEYRMLWNCITDHTGAMTRDELLSPWPREKALITFHQSETAVFLRRVSLPRINFAFLDGAHDRRSVASEVEYVSSRQSQGDVIIFDDMTPDHFPEICQVVDELQEQSSYSVRVLPSTPNRGYAVCTRISE